jgi:hypothetical protein
MLSRSPFSRLKFGRPVHGIDAGADAVPEFWIVFSPTVAVKLSLLVRLVKWHVRLTHMKEPPTWK